MPKVNEMPHSSSDSERLLVLTLVLETAIQERNWRQVSELFAARQCLMAELSSVPAETLEKIGMIENRILSALQKSLLGVRADLRNLTAALRIAGPYSRAQRASTLSLAS